MTAPGGPDVLRLQECPDPVLHRSTDVLIRLKAAGVNPIDTKLRQRGTFYPHASSAILGCDGAGIVEAIAPQVTRFRPGDEVYFCRGGLGQDGNYAQLIVVDESYLAAKPRSLSFVEAAAAPLVLITAWEALYDRGRLEAGRQVLVQAGAGGVGHMAVQLARLKGAAVATTVSTDEKANLVRSLGADPILRYTQVDPVQAVMEWTNGEGVDLSFDTIGGPLLSQSIACTRVYGDVVTILAPDAATDWKTARDRNLRISYELMLTPQLKGLVQAQRDQVKILQQCARLFDSGDLKVQVSRTFPLAEAAAAHQWLETGHVTGKVVLVIP